jgi:hypothetical protein
LSKTAVYDYSTSPASNTDVDGVDATGATGLVKSGDNYTRSMMSHIKGFALDLGSANTVGGTADVITVTLASAPSALVDGMRFTFNASAANTGATTLNVTPAGGSAFGAKKLMKWEAGSEAELSANEIPAANALIEVIYDSARDSANGAFMKIGSSVAAATTSAAGIVELATPAEAFQASSTALAVTPAGLANLYSIALNNAIEIADLKGSRLNMAGGIADAYDSETDVDTATSTNESYDAGNDLYSPSSVASSDQTSTHTSSTASGNTVSASGNLGASFEEWRAFDKTTGAPAADTNTWVESWSSGRFIQYQFGSAKTIASYTIKSAPGSGSTQANRAPNAWTLKGSNTGAYGGEEVTLDTRSGESGWTNGGQVRSYSIASPASYTYYRLIFTANNGDANIQIDEITFLDASVINNMTLVSNAFTATAAPTVARIATFIDPQEAITINTDFTAEVSRDGGTTWTAVTLALVSNPVGTVEQYEGTVSISAQPSGSSMKYRLKTLNNKDIDVTGTVFQWS